MRYPRPGGGRDPAIPFESQCSGDGWPGRSIAWSKAGKARSFERQIEFVRVEGAFVILMGLEIIEPVSSNPTAGLVAGQVITRRFTNIWKNEAGTWRLTIRHANVFARRQGENPT